MLSLPGIGQALLRGTGSERKPFQIPEVTVPPLLVPSAPTTYSKLWFLGSEKFFQIVPATLLGPVGVTWKTVGSPLPFSQQTVRNISLLLLPGGLRGRHKHNSLSKKRICLSEVAPVTELSLRYSWIRGLHLTFSAELLSLPSGVLFSVLASASVQFSLLATKWLPEASGFPSTHIVV